MKNNPKSLEFYLLDKNWIFNPVCSVWEYFFLALISNCFPDLKWLFEFDLSSTNITSFMNLRVFDENQNWVSLQMCSAKAFLKMQCHLLTAETWLHTFLIHFLKCLMKRWLALHLHFRNKKVLKTHPLLTAVEVSNESLTFHLFLKINCLLGGGHGRKSYYFKTWIIRQRLCLLVSH